jgi:hypothetical protein
MNRRQPRATRATRAREHPADDFSDVPADARPLIRQSAIMAYAATDPEGKWFEDWASDWTDSSWRICCG